MKPSEAMAGLATPAYNNLPTTVNPHPLVSATNLSAGYGNRTVLHKITLAVHRGEFVGLLGPNGCGKSTLLHTLTGYHQPAHGNIQIEGKPIASLNRRTIAASIAFVPQKTDSTFSFTAMDMVLMGRHPYSGFAATDSRDDISRATAALEELQIVELAHRPFAQLSGGEQQLVLLARSFAQASPLLMQDEPLTGLDIRHQFQLMAALKARTTSNRNGALATFHDLTAAARWCDRVILLSAGRIVADAPPAQAITPHTLAQVYGVIASVQPDPTSQGLTIYISEPSGSYFPSEGSSPIT